MIKVKYKKILRKIRKRGQADTLQETCDKIQHALKNAISNFLTTITYLLTPHSTVPL
jgi:hypothetical protein